MKAAEIKVERFLSNNDTAFAIPVYQRNYDWAKLQCQQLFKDILAAGIDDENTGHFIGSVVYIHDDVHSVAGLQEFTIIDGQQRLTTLTLIYIALYRHFQAAGQDREAQRIFKTYLINEFADEDNRLKLKPSVGNKVALAQLVDGNENLTHAEYSRLIENFGFFQRQISDENAALIMRGMAKLIIVDIALERQKDNPQRIFESLNSTGLELSQADLIRNYILMGLPRKEQERVFRQIWKPIENNARNLETNKSRVSGFIRDYLTLKQKDIPNQGAVYTKFKERFPHSNSVELTEALTEIRNLSAVYGKLLNPQTEPDPVIAWELDYVRTLEINVSYPFLMPVYRDYQDGILSRDDFAEVLRLVQSFVWRRAIIGLPTNALNKIFMGLYDHLDPNAYLPSIQRVLLQRGGSQRFPRDPEVLAALSGKDVYSMKGRARAYMFDKLENHNNKERVDVSAPGITVEHIFPQNPDRGWRDTLDEDEYAAMGEQHLNTIGNLTLSGNNGRLSNKTFVEKRDMNVDGGEQGYRFSRLWLNRDLKDLDRWTVAEIIKRTERISQRFLEVWPAPSIDVLVDANAEEVNIFDADEPRYKKLEYAVFRGKRLWLTQVSRLYVEVIEQLLAEDPEAIHGTKVGNRLQLTAGPEALRQATQVADGYFVEGNIDSTTKFERLKFLLTELGLEEELYVKFG